MKKLVFLIVLSVITGSCMSDEEPCSFDKEQRSNELLYKISELANDYNVKVIIDEAKVLENPDKIKLDKIERLIKDVSLLSGRYRLVSKTYDDSCVFTLGEKIKARSTTDRSNEDFKMSDMGIVRDDYYYNAFCNVQMKYDTINKNIVSHRISAYISPADSKITGSSGSYNSSGTQTNGKSLSFEGYVNFNGSIEFNDVPISFRANVKGSCTCGVGGTADWEFE